MRKAPAPSTIASRWSLSHVLRRRIIAPSTALRAVPLPRFAGEDQGRCLVCGRKGCGLVGGREDGGAFGDVAFGGNDAADSIGTEAGADAVDQLVEIGLAIGGAGKVDLGRRRSRPSG